jgi:DNA mismatch repair protein MutL
MGRITRLPGELANQIAAGEVVERPASVVKELVENALDAGARRIAITIELGGKALVRVEDDGDGMEPDDARLSVERHATSKISRAEDLDAILTLGFRGEALPSIASVSHFCLRTRARGAVAGTELKVHGGLIATIAEAGMPEGTVVEVRDLFYNLPARRKFLKSDAAESAQVSRLVTQLALGYPEVGFTLVSAARTVLRCPPVPDLAARFYQLFGDRSDLVPVEKEAGGLRITGYVAALAETGPKRGPQNVFVNRRIVRDRTIAHAIIEAYSAASIKERGPEVHLFIEMAADSLDVNVHPTKAEVRFRHQSLVHEVVRRAIGEALGEGTAPELQLRPTVSGAPEPWTPSIPGVLHGGSFPSRWQRLDGPFGAIAPDPLAAGSPAEGAMPTSAIVVPGPLETAADSERIRPMIPLGQLRDTFIIAVDDEGLAIIDQHVAHERVLFERMLQRLTSGRLESQRLLEPALVELPPGGREALVERREELERLGFEIDGFGGSSVRISAVPALLSGEQSIAAIRELAEDLEGIRRDARVDDTLKQIAATTACHAAVKANDRLTHEKMAHILDELRQTAYSTVCPHGRPVMLRLTRREIEKNFQRI